MHRTTRLVIPVCVGNAFIIHYDGRNRHLWNVFPFMTHLFKYQVVNLQFCDNSHHVNHLPSPYLRNRFRKNGSHPPPRTHLTRYYGVIAPHASLREKVIDSAGPSAAIMDRMKQAEEKLRSNDENAKMTDSNEDKPSEKTESKPKASSKWAMLIARIYEILPLFCLSCNNRGRPGRPGRPHLRGPMKSFPLL